MQSSLETLMERLQTVPHDPAKPLRIVRHADGTTSEGKYNHGPEDQPYTGDEEEGVRGLFGDSVAYQKYKKEQPRHRLILWMILNGHKPKEVATALRLSVQTIYQVQNQPWFQQAFCELSTEMGNDAMESYLQGQVVETCKTLVSIRDEEKAPYSVRKAACDSILDRVRGKPTVHVKQEVTGHIDNVVYDAAVLLEEQKKNEQILKSRGIGGN